MKNSKVKLHLGSGTVYLQDFINVDIVGELAVERPDLVKENLTTIDNYYKRPYVKKIFGHNKRGKIVVDVKADITKMEGFNADSVDDILMVNVIDHLRFQDFIKALKVWRRILKPYEGRIIIDVGDALENGKLLLKAKNQEELEWALRLIYCHSRDQWDTHYWGFTPSYLEAVMKKNGFKQVWTTREFIKHVYPAFQSCFKKT